MSISFRGYPSGVFKPPLMPGIPGAVKYSDSFPALFSNIARWASKLSNCSFASMAYARNQIHKIIVELQNQYENQILDAGRSLECTGLPLLAQMHIDPLALMDSAYNRLVLLQSTPNKRPEDGKWRLTRATTLENEDDAGNRFNMAMYIRVMCFIFFFGLDCSWYAVAAIIFLLNTQGVFNNPIRRLDQLMRNRNVPPVVAGEGNGHIPNPAISESTAHANADAGATIQGGSIPPAAPARPNRIQHIITTLGAFARSLLPI